MVRSSKRARAKPKDIYPIVDDREEEPDETSEKESDEESGEEEAYDDTTAPKAKKAQHTGRKRATPKQSTKTPAQRKRKQPAAAPEASESGNTLFEAVRHNSAMEAVAAEWVGGYSTDPEGALKEVLNLLFLMAGATQAYEAPTGTKYMDMSNEEWEELVASFVQDQSAQDQQQLQPRYFALDGKGPTKNEKRSTANFCEFWSRLVEACKAGSGVSVEPLDDVITIISNVSTAPITELRHATTLAAEEVGYALAQEGAAVFNKKEMAERQLASTKSKVKGNASNKAKALEAQVDRLREGSEAIVELLESLFKGVFIHRYRDSNEHIRAASIEGFGRWILALPKQFAQDNFLKYLGWTLNDPKPCVRIAALRSLTHIFETEDIDFSPFERFNSRFLPRLHGLATDVNGEVIKESIRLLRVMFNAGLLPATQEEDLALDEVSSSVFEEGLPLEARTEALAFHLDRLEDFDGEDAQAASGSASLTQSQGRGGAKKQNKKQKKKIDRNEVVIGSQVDALVHIVEAHVETQAEEMSESPSGTSEGTPDPELALACADALVTALWPLPQASLLTEWDIILSRLELDDSDHAAAALDDLAQTILLRMVGATIDQLEAAAGSGQATGSGAGSKKSVGKQAREQAQQQLNALTPALLRALPALLTKFRGDSRKVAMLMALPQHLAAEGAALARYKAQFGNLLKMIADVMHTSSDEAVFAATSGSLKALLGGEHGHQGLVEETVQSVFAAVTNKLLAASSADSVQQGQSSSSSSSCDEEYSLGRALLQLRQLACLIDPRERMDVSQISERVQLAVEERASRFFEDEEESPTPKLEMARLRLNVLQEGCSVLLLLFFWAHNDTYRELKALNSSVIIDLEDQDEGEHASLAQQAAQAVALREGVVSALKAVLALPFVSVNDEQPPEDCEEHPMREEEAAQVVQLQRHAFNLANQLRSAIPVPGRAEKLAYLSKVAWHPDSTFTWLLQRHFEKQTVEAAEKGEDAIELIRPLAQSVWSNADKVNKRQAAAVLSHFVHSGPEAADLVKAFAAKLKSLNGVQYLEVMMATLVTYWQKWVSSRDREEEEEEEEEGFNRWSDLGQRLAKSLGVGPLKAKDMKHPFLRFMKEGVRISLSDAPDNFRFLSSMAPHTNKLSAPQRKYLAAFFDDTCDAFPDDMMELKRSLAADMDEAKATEAKANEDSVVPGAWKTFFLFRQQLGGPGATTESFAQLMKSPTGSTTKRRRSALLSHAAPPALEFEGQGTKLSVTSASESEGQSANEAEEEPKEPKGKSRKRLSARSERVSELLPVAEEEEVEEEDAAGDSQGEGNEQEQEESEEERSPAWRKRSHSMASSLVSSPGALFEDIEVIPKKGRVK